MDTVYLKCVPCDESLITSRLHRGNFNLICNLDKFNEFFNAHREHGELLDNMRFAFPPAPVVVDPESVEPQPSEPEPKRKRKAKAADEE